MAARPPKTQAPSVARTTVRRSALMQVLLLALAAAASALKAPARGGIHKMMLHPKAQQQQQHTHSFDQTASLALTRTARFSVIDMQKDFCDAVASADAVEGAAKDELALCGNMDCFSLSKASEIACKVVAQTGAGRTSTKYLGTPTEGRQMLAALWFLPPTPRYSCGRGKIICNVGPLPPRVECSVQPSAEEEEEAAQVAAQLYVDCVEADARVRTYDRSGDDAAPDASKKDDAAIAIVCDASKPVVQSFLHLPSSNTVTIDVKLGVEVMRDCGSPLRCRSTQVQNCEKVHDVKCVIKDKAGIPVEDQHLYCGGKLLEDGSLREDCIKKHSNIYLVHGLLGGMPASDRPRRAPPAPAPAAAPALVPLDMTNEDHVKTFKEATLEIISDHNEKMDEDDDVPLLQFKDLREILKEKFEFKGGRGPPKIIVNVAFFNAKFKEWAADYKKRLEEEEETPETEYWDVLDVERYLRSDHLSSAVVDAKGKAVEDVAPVAAILRKYKAWREPEIVNGDELKLGGHLEDGTCQIVKAYKCADVAKEKKLWAATSNEEKIIKYECARLAGQNPKLVAVCVCDQPGQSAVDLPIYVCEDLREALAKYDEFAHLAGPARAVAVHVRTGAAKLAFSGVSFDDAKDAGEERLSVFTGVATTYHHVNHSEKTVAPRKRKPLPTYVSGQDVKTGVRCWDEEDESSPVEYVDGMVLYLSGEFDVETGDFGPGFARMQTSINERTDGTPATVYSPAAAEVLNACDTSLGFDRVTNWGPTVVNRRECSIGAALLCVACGVGDLFKCVRPYHVDAFKTWPYLLGDEMYNAKHLVELDNTLELVYILKAYCGVNVHFSGASREDTDDAAFDIILEKSDDDNCPILMLRKRDVVVEIKNEWAKLLRKKLRAGHGRAEVESDSDSEKKKDKDPGEEEQSTGRPVDPKKVDVTISFQASAGRSDSPGRSLFGPGRSEAAAVMRHKRQELIDESRVKDATLSLEEAMRRAAEEMWKTSGYRYRGVVCAAADLYKDEKKPSYFDVNPDLEQDLKTAITDAFNTEIARNHKAMGGQHDGDAEHAIKKLVAADLSDLQEAKSKLVAAIDKANGEVVTPHGAPWAGLVSAIEAEAADALKADADARAVNMSTKRVLEEATHRLPTLTDENLQKLKKHVDEEVQRRERAAAKPAKKRATSGGEAAPKKKTRPAKKK